MIPKLLNSLEIGWRAWWDKNPRGQVSRFHKTSLKRFTVKKTIMGNFEIERIF